MLRNFVTLRRDERLFADRTGRWEIVDQPAMSVTVYRIELTALHLPGEKLITFQRADLSAFEQVRAWAQVRGYDRAVRAIDNAFGHAPPPSGFHVVINKPTSLLIAARWPWYDAAEFPPHFADKLWWLVRDLA